MIMVVLSTVFSEHKINTIFGVPDQFQSLFVLLIYCILCFYSYQFIHTEKDIHKILKPLLYSIGFLIIIGISQILGHDLLTSSIGKSIITIFLNETTDMSLNFGKTVFLTLFNPNYVGLYCVLILPILFVLFLYSQQLKQQFIYLILFIGLTVCLIGSESATGIITVIPCLLFLFFLCRHKFGKYKKIITIVYSAFIVLGICLFFFMNLPQRLHNAVFKETNYEIQQIELKDDYITFTCNNEPLNISYNPNGIDGEILKITDGNGNLVESTLSDDSSYLLINDSRFPKFLLQLILYEDLDGNELNVFSITHNNTNWYFTNDTDDGTYYYINNYGNLIKINNTSPSALPESFNSFATGRGYIWSKTLPLLKDSLIVGSGADTFLFKFPNDDYVGMYNNGNHGKIMTKPHSFYLQTWVETGLISLIALLIFYGIYVIMSCRLYLMKPLDNYMKQIGAAIFVSSLGYMFALLFNDSSITVAPVFWILLGIGFAINQITKRALLK